MRRGENMSAHAKPQMEVRERLSQVSFLPLSWGAVIKLRSVRVSEARAFTHTEPSHWSYWTNHKREKGKKNTLYNKEVGPAR